MSLNRVEREARERVKEIQGNERETRETLEGDGKKMETKERGKGELLVAGRFSVGERRKKGLRSI